MAHEHPHDAFFKRVFARPDLAADLLRRRLPHAVIDALDLERLEMVTSEFVDGELRSRRADLVFRAPLVDDPDRQAYVFMLVEHQSRPDRWMALRVLTYVVDLWNRHVEEARGAAERVSIRLPAVIPLVVHQGRRPWRSPRSLSELLDLSASLQRVLEPHLPRLTLLIDDLAADDDVTRDTRLALTAAALLTMRFVRSDDDPAAFTARWATLLSATRGEPHRTSVLDVIVQYLYHADQRLHATQIVDAARSIDDAETKEVLMTLAEQFEQIGLRKGLEKGIEQGIERGRLTGRAEALLNQIHLKFGAPTAAVIERVGAAGLPELDRWTARILSADSIDALFAN